jgi:hypothetical protein
VIGYLITVGVVAAGMLLALAPLRRSGALGILSWLLRASTSRERSEHLRSPSGRTWKSQPQVPGRDRSSSVARS